MSSAGSSDEGERPSKADKKKKSKGDKKKKAANEFHAAGDEAWSRRGGTHPSLVPLVPLVAIFILPVW